MTRSSTLSPSTPRLAAIACLLALAAGTASAAPVFSDNFNDPTYGQGTVRYGNTERWGYGPAQTARPGTGGWTFAGDVIYVHDAHSADGAILLTDRSPVNSASPLLPGLVAGQTYNLSFLLSGDNAEGQNYGLYAWIDADLIFAEGATVGAPGSSKGTLESALFVAKSSTATLKFNEYTFAGSSASPVIDDVSVSLPEPASLALVSVSLLGLGAARRRQQRQ